MRSERPTPRLLRLLVAFGLIATCGGHWAQVQARQADRPAPPNIIYILADDLGYGDLGAYGQKTIPTLRLDQIAAEGMRFTQHYAGSTVCAPSRSALMTGLHTGHTTVRGNTGIGGVVGLGGKSGRIPLQDADVTVAEVLREAGYATGLVGKWGLGEPGTSGTPGRQGFDYFFGFLNQRNAHSHYPPYLWRNEQVVPLTENQGGKRGAYAHDLFTGEALAFVRRQATAHPEQPFFLYLAYTVPHSEMAVPSDSLLDSYRSLPQPDAAYAAMIRRLDRDTGQILDLIAELGIDESTLVLFASDNGPHASGGHDHTMFDSNGPLRGIKRDLYEGGIRTPLIARWPGRVAAGTMSDHVSAFWDFLPTAADLAGTETPPGLDGISFAPALLGRPQPAHDYLYWEFHREGGTGGATQAVRIETWKAVRQAVDAPVELYDLDADLGETTDVAADHPDVVQRATALLDRARTSSPFFPVPALDAPKRDTLGADAPIGRSEAERSGAAAGGRPPPNLIFIMADDLGYGDLGAYGQKQIRTPNLDRMAREGTRFTQYYAGSTVCAPSRGALMTGLHTGHSPVRNNVGWQPRGDAPLRAADVTPAEALKAAGYATGAFGKWALGLKDTPGAPHRQGFDAFFGLTDQSAVKRYYHGQYQQIEDGETVHVEADSVAYSHDLFMERALRFIDEHQDAPFFLYLPVPIPHADLAVPDSAMQPYVNAEGESLFDEPEDPQYGGYREEPQPYATYAAMVTYLDASIGRMLDHLEKLGIDGETIVFFTSDNGPHAEGGYDPAFFGSNGPLRGMKRDLYEGGIRVPMLAWGPGYVPSGRTSDHVWAAWDVLPTLADLAGAPIPSGLDGISVEDALTGEGVAPRHAYLYWEFFHPGREVFKQAVRRGDWKAVRFTEEDGATRTELYHLGEDLSETTDVARNHPQVVSELEAIMDEAHTVPELDEFKVAGVDE